MKARLLNIQRLMPVAMFAFMMTCLSLSADGAVILIDEDFNSPQAGAVNNTNLRDNPLNFPDWNFTDTLGITPQYKVGPSDGTPVSAGDGYVKFDSFNSGSDFYSMQYDTGHAWSSNDVFTLSINATEQLWNSVQDRFMVVSIKETARTGDELTGATLWTMTQALILDPNHDSAGEGWGPNNSFSWTFSASDFVTGTPGNAISFQIEGAGSRGYHFDNVNLSVLIPEPASLALLGLGSVLMLSRRRN